MFKKGDLVIGKPNNYYGITNEESISIVIQEPDIYGLMRVRVLYNGSIGGRGEECAIDEFNVQSDKFNHYTKELAKNQGIVFLNEHEQVRYLKTLRKAIDKPYFRETIKFLSKKFRIAIRSNSDRVLMTNINEKEELILIQLDRDIGTYSNVYISKINLSDVEANTFDTVRGINGFRGLGSPMNFVR